MIKALVNFLRGCPKPESVRRREMADRALDHKIGSLRQEMQLIQSHSRRLSLMAGALEQKERYGEAGHE